jgi:hypothetical protein
MTETYTSWDTVPGNLKTRTQLKKLGLRPAKDQFPAADYYSRYYNEHYPLYDIGQTIIRRKPSPAQLEALKKANRQRELNSRCAICEIPFDVFDRERIPITDSGNGAYMCFICRDKKRASQWARGVLADTNAVILDTETTGFGEEDQVIEVSIIDIDSETLLNTLVRPLVLVSGGASSVHGIREETLFGAPAFPDIYSDLRRILERASRVVVYNAEFDHRLLNQTRRAWKLPLFKPAPFECAMLWYAAWFGEWSNYYNNYKWQPLNGGHRSFGDCMATLRLIKEMAELEIIKET